MSLNATQWFDVPVQLLYQTAGWVSLIVGLVGIVVPGLPTTPFLLLSAYCFGKSTDVI
jgi:uncharacterized membrane protein YbaN (DUF454 family)